MSSVAYLSRRFVLDSMALLANDGGKNWGGRQLRGGGKREKHGRAKRSLFHIRRSAAAAPVLPPTLLPVALMLSGAPKVGRAAAYWMYNPRGEKMSRVTLHIAAESLFTVTDSATRDSAARWIPTHTDTVRAWSVVATGVDGRVAPLGGEVMLQWLGVTTVEPEITVWVDVRGNIVSASEPGGVHLLRTTYEIAYLARDVKPRTSRR
jgi:hypothetical protein